MKSKLVLAVAFSTMLLTGCITPDDPNRNTKIGAGIGAVGGAVIGKQIGGDKGLLLGGILGGALGGGIGYDMDLQRQKLRQQLAAEEQANQVAIQEINDNTIKVTIDGDVTFATGSWNINPQFQYSLDKIASSAREYGSTVRIVGHTDSVGSSDFNQTLSERRASAVARHFVSRGVSSSKVSAFGVGESQPIASNDTSSGRAVNRRVEIFITK